MKPNLKKKKLNFSLYWMYAIIILVLVGVYYLDQNSITKPVTYSEFEKYVTEGGVEKIVVYTNKNEAEAFITDSLAKKIFTPSQYTQGTQSGYQDQHINSKCRQASGQNRTVATGRCVQWLGFL